MHLLSEDDCRATSYEFISYECTLMKHPKKRALVPTTLVGDPSVSVPLPHPIVFDQLDAECIRHAILKTSGAAGPSGLDTAEHVPLFRGFPLICVMLYLPLLGNCVILLWM